MNQPTYSEYHEFYANRCSACGGKGRIPNGVSWIECPCQRVATAKFRLEQIPIPIHLRQKTWEDFTGLISENNLISGRLVPSSAVTAKQLGMKYCFGDEDGYKDRAKSLIVHRHLRDGQNVVIAGDRSSGKSLLAFLILKEVAYAGAYFNLRLSYHWVRASNIINAARWDSSQTVDHEFIDEMQEADFLFVDGIGVPTGGHNNPADMDTLNVLFYYRKVNLRPTIFISSSKFWKQANDENTQTHISRRWGEEFLNLMIDPNNVVIELIKEGS